MPVDSPYSSLLAEVAPVEATVELLGSTTHYWSYGPHDAAVTMLFVHGYRGEHHGLEPVIAQLRDVRIIAPDLPAFGRSTPMTDAAHDIEGYGRWLAAFVAARGLEQAVVLGHSFGSIVVAHAVASSVIAPARIVLVNPIASLPSAAGPIIASHRLAAAFGDRAGALLVGNGLVVRVMSQALTVTRDRALRAFVHDQHARYFSDFATMGTMLESFRASVSHTVTEVADRIAVPTLLIGAEQDQISSAEAVWDLAERIPGSTLVMIPRVGHLIHYETPRPAAEAIVEFLGAGRLA